MREQNVSALLVDHGQAIISERGMTAALGAGLLPTSRVGQIATRHPITVPADYPIGDAAALMLNQDIRHLVVRFSDNRCGMVSLRVLLAVLLQAARPELWLEHLRVQLRVIQS
jgi:CBS domain-containing protein